MPFLSLYLDLDVWYRVDLWHQSLQSTVTKWWSETLSVIIWVGLSSHSAFPCVYTCVHVYVCVCLCVCVQVNMWIGIHVWGRTSTHIEVRHQPQMSFLLFWDRVSHWPESQQVGYASCPENSGNLLVSVSLALGLQSSATKHSSFTCLRGPP